LRNHSNAICKHKVAKAAKNCTYNGTVTQPLQCDLQTQFITKLQDIKELLIWLQQPLHAMRTLYNHEELGRSRRNQQHSRNQHAATSTRSTSQNLFTKWLERINTAQQPTGSDTKERHITAKPFRMQSQNTMAQSTPNL
jgi:hypothetical protein